MTERMIEAGRIITAEQQADAWYKAIIAQRRACHGHDGVHTPRCLALRYPYPCRDCGQDRVVTDDDKLYCRRCGTESRPR